MSQGGKGVAKLPHLETGKSRQKASDLLNVGSRYISDAKRIKQASPELINKLDFLDSVKKGKDTPTRWTELGNVRVSESLTK